MKTFCCFDSLLFYTIFITMIVRSRSQQDNFNITNLPKEVRLSNYNITEVSRGPSEISYQEVIVDNHQENTPNFQREMVELNPYGPFSRKYKQSFFQRKILWSILNYFISPDIAHNAHHLKHQYKLQNHHDREVSIQRTALGYARKFDHFLYSYREHVNLPSLFVLAIVSSVTLGLILLYLILYLMSELFKLAITILILWLSKEEKNSK